MRPPHTHDHQLLADVAGDLVTFEIEEMRQLVLGGHLDREAGVAHIRVMRSIAEGWRALAAIEPEPDHLRDPDRRGAWRSERLPALEQAHRRAQARAAAAPHDSDLATAADAAGTLLWWETAQPSARWLVDTTIALRAAAAARELERLAA